MKQILRDSCLCTLKILLLSRTHIHTQRAPVCVCVCVCVCVYVGGRGGGRALIRVCGVEKSNSGWSRVKTLDLYRCTCPQCKLFIIRKRTRMLTLAKRGWGGGGGGLAEGGCRGKEGG